METISRLLPRKSPESMDSDPEDERAETPDASPESSPGEDAMLLCLQDFLKDKNEEEMRSDIEDIHKVTHATNSYQQEYTSEAYDKDFYRLCVIKANREIAHKNRMLTMKVEKTMARLKAASSLQEKARIYFEEMKAMRIASLEDLPSVAE